MNTPLRITLTLLLQLLVSLAFSQNTLRGRVTEAATNEPLPGATVYFPDLKRGTATNNNGYFYFSDLPKSRLLIQVSFIGYGAVTAILDLGTTDTINFVMNEAAIEAQEVVITGSGISTDNSRSSISIVPVARDALITSPSTNIIDAVSAVPGISQITTGGDVSKPVIRGLSYNHVITINEGVRQEGQQWGDEHGVEIDQFSADRIEILKGPASLFYGSDAMGGVINILEPIHAPMNTIRGEIISQFATNNKMTNNSLLLEGNHRGMIWRVRGSYKNAAPFKTPGEYIYNSGFSEANINAMAGLNKKWGFTHLHFSSFNARIGMISTERDSATGLFLNIYGTPVQEKDAKARTIELPYQKISHNKITSITNLVFKQSQYRFNLGFQSNSRNEFEDQETNPSLAMLLQTFTGDLKFTHLFGSSLELVSGVSVIAQTNQNRGEEYLIPDYNLQDAGGFIYLKKSLEEFTFNAGMRFDTRHVTGKSLFLPSSEGGQTHTDTVFPGFSSTFSAFSGSAGMTWSPIPQWNFKLNAGSGFRSPNIAELGSNGVHPGTMRYEIGNPALKAENSIQVDGEVTYDIHWLSVVISGYYNHILNYIYQQRSGDEEIMTEGTSYPVYRFVQGNSTLRGFEVEIDFHPVDQLHFENSVAYVSGTNNSTGVPLPYIPALNTSHQLKWYFETDKKTIWYKPYISAGLRICAAQNRVDTFETPTRGYMLLDASAGTKLRIGKQLLTLFVSGTNLTNQKYVDHLNRLKDYDIHNPGWGITVGIVAPFSLMEEKSVKNHQ